MFQLNLNYAEVVNLLDLLNKHNCAGEFNRHLFGIYDQINKRLLEYVSNLRFRELVRNSPDFQIIIYLFLKHSDDMPLSTQVIDAMHNILDEICYLEENGDELY